MIYVQVVAWKSNDPLHDVQPGGIYRYEDHDIAALDLAVGKNRAHPTGLRRKALTIYEDVVAYQKSVFHRAGRDFESLHDEGDDEQACDQHRSHGGHEFRSGLFRLLWSCLFVFIVSFGHAGPCARVSTRS